MNKRSFGLTGSVAARFLLLGCAVLGLRASPSVAAAPQQHATQTVVLAGGCFWGMEAVFESLKGVSNVVSGYAGGSKATAHYEIVSTGLTGHAESVEVTFDPSKITFGQLLKVYFTIAHDPTQRNRQSPDTGPQYRSAIFYTDESQKRAAYAYVRQLTNAKVFHDPIVTQIVPLRGFFAAEDYHQHYFDRNPSDSYIVYNDKPKVEQLRKQFPGLIKTGKSR